MKRIELLEWVDSLYEEEAVEELFRVSKEEKSFEEFLADLYEGTVEI